MTGLGDFGGRCRLRRGLWFGKVRRPGLIDSRKRVVCMFVVLVVYSLSRVKLFATPTDCSPPGSSVHGISLARILGCPVLQGIFPKQESNLHLLLDRWILYH